MFSNRKWQQFALLLNLVGTALLFYSFQATSSNFRLVTSKHITQPVGKKEGSSLCVYGRALITEFDDGSGSMFGPCPDWENARAAAVVNIEHPFFEGLGFFVLILGFFIQYLSVPQPRTIAGIRKELKLLQAQERAAKRGT